MLFRSCQLRLIYEIVRHTFISTSRSAAVPELWTLDGTGCVYMNSHDNVVSGSRRRYYAERPFTFLFTALSYFGFALLVAASFFLCDAGWPELFSPLFWFFVMMVVAELGVVVLAVRFGRTEKPAQPKD